MLRLTVILKLVLARVALAARLAHVGLLAGVRTKMAVPLETVAEGLAAVRAAVGQLRVVGASIRHIVLRTQLGAGRTVGVEESGGFSGGVDGGGGGGVCVVLLRAGRVWGCGAAVGRDHRVRVQVT